MPQASSAIRPDTPPRAAASHRRAATDRQSLPDVTVPNRVGSQPLPPSAVDDFAPRVLLSDATQPAPSIRSAATAPAAAIVPASPAVAPAAASAPAVAKSGSGACTACWGAGAPDFGQTITTVINHLFNSTFDMLSTLPGGPFTNLLEGTLVLVRRSLFLIPTGVTATQQGSELTVKVNTGSVAYVRENGGYVEVSGLPSFGHADRFNGSTVKDVVVSNPGNAGCAGFVLESGHVAAALRTDQIDSMRFRSDARFDEMVKATVTGASLTLQDAVRSNKSVEFDAAVVLKNDVEVVAGNGVDAENGRGNVTFTSTVDATKAGKQSLTVTGLGTTTFAAAVGGQAPLASLLTRGIAPLRIEQTADTRTIPLHYAPYVESGGKVQVKYGINVAIGDNPAQLYEFDTGGTAFFAGYNPPFWKDVPLTAVGDTVSYTSGNTYNFVVADAAVTLGDGDQTVSTGQPIQVGAILSGGNDKKNPPVAFDFTDPDAPPVDGNFFGDFGASFGTFDFRKAGQELMASPLLQLPGNLSTGFLVQLGPIGTTDPRLTVGVTDALREQFPYGVPVDAAPGSQTYPVSGYPVLELFGITPTYYADGPQGKQPIGCGDKFPCPLPLQTVIDSGAPSTGLRVTEGTPYEVNVSKGKGQLQSGAELIAEFKTVPGREPLTWRLTAGDNQSVNFVGYGGESVATTAQNANTGLNFYNTFDVMFDASRKTIYLRHNDGAATVIAGDVTTTGDQTFKQNAQLSGTYTTGGGKFAVGGVTQLLGDVVVEAGTGDVSFFGTVDGSTPGTQSLTVNSTGATSFTRGIGELVSLDNLTTNAGGTTATSGATTKGNQSFGDDARLSSAYSTKGSFSVAGDTTLTRDVTITADRSGQNITFGGRIDGAPGRGFQLNLSTSGGTVDLNGDVGATHPLGGLTVDQNDETATTTFNAAGSIALSGGVGDANTKGLSVGGSGPVILNLTKGGVIQGFSDSGVVIGEGSSGTLSNFSIGNNGGDGIQANDTKSLTISDNALLGNKVGIRITASKATDAKNTVSGNIIGSNSESGVTVDTSLGNKISGNQIYSNGVGNTGGPKTADGIVLTKNGNGGQSAAKIESAVQSAPGTITVYVKLDEDPNYSGTYQLEFFLTSPANTSEAQAQGRQLIGTATDFVAGKVVPVPLVVGSQDLTNSFITVTATPGTAPFNTSPFSVAATVTASSTT